ncbi:MAG: CDP-diacylglycerol--serine O-phosphatidyltransferase [Bacteroides sp.]|nr:CDP-diacylglycerol--serine O-phosphatidyltransferase [Bacteroides sp.]
MNPIVRNIPNTITCINILSGCVAIVAASKGTQPLWGLQAFQWAFIFIAIGAVADFLDGFAARALHAYSNLGKELDSLCDLVTFGVAPAMIMFHLLEGMGVAAWMPWATLLIPISGAVRLARFNIDTRQTTYFIGMPIPANAIFWIGYAATMTAGVGAFSEWYIFLPILIIECWLMNAPMKMFSLKIKDFSLKKIAPQLMLVAAAIILCITLGVGGLMWLMLFYIVLSVICSNKIG